MEREERRQEIAALSFPDFTLMVGYAEALAYVQGRLAMFGWGDLKPFCEAQKFTYTNIVGLKNGTLKREEPRLVQRVLLSLSVPTELIRFPPDSPSASFLLSDAAALVTFQAQVAFFQAAK